MKKLLLTIIVILIVTSGVQAALIPHYRMDSFALLSDAIIYCKEKNVEFQEIKHDKGNEIKTFVRCEVLESYKGEIKKGSIQVIEFDSIFKRHKIFKGGYSVLNSKGNVSRIVPPEYLPPEKSLIFLKKESNSYRPITAKIVQRNTILQFCQCEGNPGPLILTEQKPENLILKNREKYEEKEFMKDFLIALRKSTSLKKPIKASPWI